MPKIHILDKSVAERIAAGEVVERPASVVKELVENAVDAGADTVTVEIQGGGIRLIRVSDNGVGILREDLPRAFVRHATSKVREAEDLEEIVTLGFRGEALCSIAAVCRVELATKSAEEEEGSCYRMEGGGFRGTEPAGHPTGTTVTVRDLFYNTPARMKFLKRDVTEGNAVAQVVEKCALSHPQVSFQFIRDGAVKLRTSGSGDGLAVIAAVYGRDFAGEMLPLDYHGTEGVHVYGYLGNPSLTRPGRGYQNFFLNGRYVRSRTASAAVEEAYKHKIMTGRFPACVIHLHMGPHLVDINVHPAKIEVRFAREKAVFDAVYFAAKTALQKLEQPLNEAAEPPRGSNPMVNAFTVRLPPEEPRQQRMSAGEFQRAFGAGNRSFREPVQMGASKVPGQPFQTHNPSNFAANAVYDKGEALERVGESFQNDAANPTNFVTNTLRGETPEHHGEPPLELRFVGELFGTYLLLEREDDQLLLVDKHAAHERILYERLKDNLDQDNRQILLSPQLVKLPLEDYSALLENLEELERMGFGVEDFGGGTVAVREVPLDLEEADVASILGEVADKLRRGNRDLTPGFLDRLYFSIACRGALKAGDKNHPLELEHLVQRLAENPQITHCPHGRPVTVFLTRRELEKLFGRLG